MTRLNRKNSAIDQAEIALDKTKVEKRSKLATKKSDFQSDDLEKVSEFKIYKRDFPDWSALFAWLGK